MISSDRALQYLALPWNWDIKFDAESGCWLATIGELPDFFAAGNSAGDAAFNSREAFVSHISGYLESGVPIPMPLNQFVEMESDNTESGLVEIAA